MGEYEVVVGKYRGKKLKEIPPTQLHNYLLFVKLKAHRDKKELFGPMLELMVIGHAYLGMTYNKKG